MGTPELLKSLLSILLPGIPPTVRDEVAKKIESSNDTLIRATMESLNDTAAKAAIIMVLRAKSDEVLKRCNVPKLLSILPFLKESPQATLGLLRSNKFGKQLYAIFIEMSSTTLKVHWNRSYDLLDSDGMEGTTQWSLEFLRAAMNVQVQAIQVTFKDDECMVGFMKKAEQIIDGLPHNKKTYVFNTSSNPVNSVHFNLMAKKDVDMFYWKPNGPCSC